MNYYKHYLKIAKIARVHYKFFYQPFIQKLGSSNVTFLRNKWHLIIGLMLTWEEAFWRSLEPFYANVKGCAGSFNETEQLLWWILHSWWAQPSENRGGVNLNEIPGIYIDLN